MRNKLVLVFMLLLTVSGGVLADHHETTSFTVTIENISGIGLFENTGVSPVPVGADGAGPALPGGAYEFVIHASAGDTLTFATMLAQSNDMFFAPDEAGSRSTMAMATRSAAMSAIRLTCGMPERKSISRSARAMNKPRVNPDPTPVPMKWAWCSWSAISMTDSVIRQRATSSP